MSISPTVSPTNEIVAALFMNDISTPDLAALKNDPQAFLLAKTNVTFDDSLGFKFVDNNAETVNLTLPYYSELQKSHVAEINEEDLGEVAGGEFFLLMALISVLATVGTCVGATSAVGSIAAGATVIVVGSVATVGAYAGGVAGAVKGAEAAQSK